MINDMLGVSMKLRGSLEAAVTSYLNSIPGHHEVYSNIIRGRYCDVFQFICTI